MTIRTRDFTESDLPAAGAIALQLWGGEVPEIPQAMRPDLYRYLARYYFVPDSGFNFAAEDASGLCGFLMAARPGTADPAPADAWMRDHLHDETERRRFAEYRNYLEGNRRAESAAAAPAELLLLFFASIRRGTGKLLLARLEEAMRNAHIPSMLLWTDETCDFSYYHRHGFHEVRHFPSPGALCGHRFETWLFRKPAIVRHTPNTQNGDE